MRKFPLSLLAAAWVVLVPSFAAAAEPARAWRKQASFRTGQLNGSEPALSADGKLLAVAGPDGSLKLWDAQTGKLRGTVRRQGRPLAALAFSADGKSLLFAVKDGSVGVWDVAGGRQQKSFRVARGELTGAAFAPGGKLLALSASGPRTGRTAPVQVWDVDTGKPRRSLAGHQHAAYTLQFSADGKKLMTAGARDRTRADGPGIGSPSDATVPEVKVWDVARGSAVTLPTGGNVFTLTPDGKTVIVAFQDMRTYQFSFAAWDVATKKRRSVFGPQREIVLFTALAPDGGVLVTGGYGAALRRWDVAKGKQLPTLAAPREPVLRVHFSADGSRLASVGADGLAHVWSAGSPSPKSPRKP